MTDATLTDAETVTDSALYSRMIDDENGIFREYALPNFGDGAHIRQCDDCAGNALRAFHQANTNRLADEFAEYDAWRAYVARTHAVAVENQQSIPEEVTPTPEDDIDTEIRSQFPGAIPDDKLAKLRALITENRELKRQVEAPIDLSDKRLWPAFGKVAAAADEAGYCSEYDRMSEAGGFPSRDELAEAGMLPAKKYEGDVYVDVTLSRSLRLTTPRFEASRRTDDFYQSARDAIEVMSADDFGDYYADELPEGWSVDSFEVDYVNHVDEV